MNASAKRFDSGDYAGALAGFQRAYEIFPSAKILFNIGLAYRKLGKNALAFQSFERFLAEGPSGGAEEKNLAQARVELEGLSKRVAFVSISSDVPSAELTLDGVALGTSNLPRRLAVDTGPHTLQLSAGGSSRSHDFSIIAGESSQVSLPLANNQVASPPLPVTQPPPAPQDIGKPPQSAAAPGEIAGGSNAGQANAGRRAWLPAARWATLFGATAALGAGVLLNLKATSTRREFDEHQPESCGASGDVVVSGPPDCYSLGEDFRSQRQYAKVGYIAGGTLAAASLVLFLISDSSSSTAAIVPGVAGVPTGVSYATRF